MKLFRFKNFVRTCAFAIVALLAIAPAKAQLDFGTDGGPWTKGWSYSQKSNSGGFNWLSSFENSRKMCYGNGKLYVVDKANTKIYIINARTGEKQGELNVANVSGGTFALYDVKYVNGHILACNLVTSATANTKVYHWASDSSPAEVLLTTNNKSGAPRVGDAFNFTGDPSGNGYIYFAESLQPNSNTHAKSYVLRYKVSNGTCENNASPEYTILDSAPSSALSVQPISDTQFWAKNITVGTDYNLYTWNSSGSATKDETITRPNTGRGNSIAPFTLANSSQQYAFVVDQASASTSGWENETAYLLKRTAANQWTKLKEFDGLGTNTNNGGTSIAVNLVNNDQGVTVGAELWYAANNQGMSYHYTGDLNPAPTPKPEEPIVVLEAKNREMRSAWLTSVWRIDWPVNYGTGTANVAKQQQELDEYLDAAQKANLNSICFQVRPMCDALYESSYEPWSRFVSGTRGTSPGWDPLAYIVKECHDRGLRLVAWVNPYRYSSKGEEQYATTERDAQLKANLSMISAPDKENANNTITILNPGKQTTIDHIVKVCKEIITKYDVDGLIFDDYFYPNGIPESSSADDYSDWKNSSTSLSFGDWRRDNVNRMVAAVYQMVQENRPECTFGISPAGVACTNATVASKHGVSPMTGTTGDWQYDGIYSDPVQWLKSKTIDYVSPQIYWPLNDSNAPFGTVAKWWTTVARDFGRHYYASHYNTHTSIMKPGVESSYIELLNEVETNRSYNTNNTPGSIFYSARCLKLGAWDDTFRKYCADNIYKYKAIPPVLTWKNKANYSAPANFTNTDGVLSWNKVSEDKLCHYAVYAVPSSVSLSEFKDSYNDARSKYLLDLTYNTSYTLASHKLTDYWYAVTAIDAANNEYDVANIGAPDYAVSGLSFTSEGKIDVDYKYDSSKDIYTFTTTGGDPFVYTTALAEDLSAGKCVLEFEYVSSGFTGGDQLQLFFGDTWNEARSSKHDGLQNTNTWTTYKVNIANQRTQFGWGTTGQQIRFDWGTHAGATIMVKNLRIREMTAEEAANFEYVEQPTGDLAGLGYFHKKGDNGLWYFKVQNAAADYNNKDYVVLKSFDANHTKYEGIPDKYFLKWILEDNTYGLRAWYVKKGTSALEFGPSIKQGSPSAGALSDYFSVSSGFTSQSGYKLVLLPVEQNTTNDIAPISLNAVTEIDWSKYGVEKEYTRTLPNGTTTNTTEDKTLGTCYLYQHHGVADITGIGYFSGLKKFNLSHERYGWYQTNSGYAHENIAAGKKVQFAVYSYLVDNKDDSENNNPVLVDFSHNPLLEEIDLAYNDLKYIDVTCLPNLKKLNLSNNSNLENLDISQNTMLEDLRLEHNWELKHLETDLAANKAMKYLQIFDTMYGWEGKGKDPNNSFQTDIVDKMPNLEVLHAFSCFFDKIDVTSLTKLKSLWLHNSIWGTRQNAKGNWLHTIDLSKNLELRDLHLHNMHLAGFEINSPYIGEDYGYEPEREIVGENTPGLEASNNYRRIYADLSVYQQKDGSYQYIYYLRTRTNEQSINDPVLNGKKGSYDWYRYTDYFSDKNASNIKESALRALTTSLADDGFKQERASNWRLASYAETDIKKNGVYIHDIFADTNSQPVLLPVINSDMYSKEEIVNHDYIADWYNSKGFSPKSARGEIVVLKYYHSKSQLTAWPSDVTLPQSICYDYDLMGDALKAQQNAPAKDGKRKAAVTNPDKYKATFYLDIDYPKVDSPTEIVELDFSEKEVSHVTYTDLAGRVSNRPFSGVNIVTTYYTDGTSKVIKQIKR